MTPMPVEHNHPINAFCTSSSVFINVLDLFNASLIVCPSIKSRFNWLVLQKIAFRLLICGVVPALNDME